MQPIFKIIADNTDITAKIQDRLISLSVIDESGIQSDSASIVLDDRDYVLELPNKGAVLEIYLGYAETKLVKSGLYTVDEITCSGAPDIITISCKAADMLTTLKIKKSRSWAQLTLSDIIQSIAAEHGLKPAISQDLATTQINHLDQTNESDLHLLTRIAKDYDAVAKPANGHLLFVAKGEAKSATGQALETVVIRRHQTSDYQVTMADRGKYLSAIAYWHDYTTGTRTQVRIGDGKPSYTLRHTYQDEAAAQGAAAAKLTALNRGKAFGSISLPIADLDAVAEAKLKLIGFREGIAGDWSITRSEFKLSESGLSSFMEFEAPKP